MEHGVHISQEYTAVNAAGLVSYDCVTEITWRLWLVYAGEGCKPVILIYDPLIDNTTHSNNE